MIQPKKLIEVAMPVKEVSAESVRDKSIRHGHISTLHLWWARRPLPVCRAVVFASLVPDPEDKNCPAPFKQAVAKYLADNKYKPYDDIPHTAAIDPMEDNMRNRLLMFIGKFSDEYVANEKSGKITPSKKQLSEGSLIKWENKNKPEIIGIAQGEPGNFTKIYLGTGVPFFDVTSPDFWLVDKSLYQSETPEIPAPEKHIKQLKDAG